MHSKKAMWRIESTVRAKKIRQDGDTEFISDSFSNKKPERFHTRNAAGGFLSGKTLRNRRSSLIPLLTLPIVQLLPWTTVLLQQSGKV